MIPSPLHLEPLENIKKTGIITGLVEVLREERIDAVGYTLWDATSWHRDYSSPAWRNRATGEHKRIGWEMVVRFENQIIWVKPDPVPNALHTTFIHTDENLLWASRNRFSRHTFNYDLINSLNPAGQISSVRRIPTVSRHDELFGCHLNQKPLKLVRGALLASTREGELVFDPFVGSGTTTVAAKELLNRVFVGSGLEEEYTRLAARRIRAAKWGSLVGESPEQFWNEA
jgi:DNA modification methylase